MDSLGWTKALSFYNKMKVGSSDVVGLSVNLGQKDHFLSSNRP